MRKKKVLHKLPLREPKKLFPEMVTRYAPMDMNIVVSAVETIARRHCGLVSWDAGSRLRDDVLTFFYSEAETSNGMVEWLLQRAPKEDLAAGRISKRICVYLRKCGVDTKDIETYIANTMQEYAFPAGKLWYDFTDEFDWRNGDFGDEGSCYWDREGSWGHSRATIAYNGGIAIRFYKSPPDNFLLMSDYARHQYGVARAFLLPDKNGMFFITNKYGLQKEYVDRSTQQALRNETGIEWSIADARVYLSDTRCYTNGDGMVLYDKNNIEHVHKARYFHDSDHNWVRRSANSVDWPYRDDYEDEDNEY